MERRKLTKEDIDKVRNVEGFPIGTDSDIISLSDAPYYTACPNPFIEDFIRENGTPYTEATDNYHCEPFAADVSEGKNDPVYNAHSYHTKVPYRAIMRYILHYTKPGDIVFDGFCGTGMTGVAAQMCGSSDPNLRSAIDSAAIDESFEWGVRKAILSDLSPMATFIAYNYNCPPDALKYQEAAKQILDQCEEKYGWMFTTDHVDSAGHPINGLDGKPMQGKINHILWSDVFVCPHCSSEFTFWDVAVNLSAAKVRSEFACPSCGSKLKKNDCDHAMIDEFDSLIGEVIRTIKQKPVLINYSIGSHRYEKAPDKRDLERIDRANREPVADWVPSNRMREGKESRRNDSSGITHVHHFYHNASLKEMAYIWEQARQLPDRCVGNHVMFAHSAANQYLSKMRRFRPDKKGGGPLSGTLYISSLMTPPNPVLSIRRNAQSVADAIRIEHFDHNDVCISTHSLTDQNAIPDNSVDYIFTDPPFGGNLNYSELNFLWEAWLKVFTSDRSEAIICDTQGKQLNEYQELMTACFNVYYRVLKPNHWMTVEFHNSQNSVWNAIQEALQRAGFIIADVRTLDKKQGSFKQVTTTSAVKQDLVISAYKPKDAFKRTFFEKAGSEETAWSFVRQHLENIPVVVVKDNKIELIAERQAFLLFDRMVAYHIMQGISVPLDSTDFYKGLDEKFLKRDNMYFLPDQVNEYDTARIVNDVEPIQFSLFVTNEKTAISWLYQQLSEEVGGPQTYAEIQPKFMQEVKSVDRYEDMPELAVLLEENFLQDEKGRWYIPDITKEGDVAKLREKKLWKEFESYMSSKGKLKLFRSEAIRVGFSRLWKDKNYQAIVDIANRLPEQTIQEDPNLLMYYDISLSRVE